MEMIDKNGNGLKCTFITAPVHRMAKIMAAQKGIMLRSVIELAIEELYARENKKNGAKKTKNNGDE